MKKILLTIIVLTLGLSETYSQEFSKNGVFFGFSPHSRWENSTKDGIGITWSIGHQRALWNNRVRLVNSLNLGNYTSKGILDAADLNANYTSLRTNLNFDVLRIQSFSVFIGSGLSLNHSSGLSRFSGYFNGTYFAINGLLGLKINPKNKRLSYELLLVDFASKSGFLELSMLKFRMVVKLK